MSDATVNVYGSVEVVGGNGGSVVGGSQDAAPEAQTFLVCFDSALVDIAGSSLLHTHTHTHTTTPPPPTPCVEREGGGGGWVTLPKPFSPAFSAQAR